MQTEGRLRKLRNVLAFAAATVIVLLAVFYLTQPFLPNTSYKIIQIVDGESNEQLFPRQRNNW